MTPSVLITRELSLDSPLRAISDINIIGKSFLEFTEVAFTLDDFLTDWVFFYSKKCVEFGLQQQDLIKYCQGRKVGAFGSGTAALLTSYGLDPAFVGDGKQNTILKYQSVAGQSSTLFVQGVQSRKTIQRSHNFTGDWREVEVYNSSFKTVDLDYHPEIVVFTSPLNVDSYHTQYAFPDAIISIGQTTADHLMTEYSLASVIADSPSELGILASLKKMLK